MSPTTRHSSVKDSSSGEMSPMSKKLVRELHIDANVSLGGGSGSSSLKRKRRSLKMDDDRGDEERKGGEEQHQGEEEEEEGKAEAKEGGRMEASSLPLTPPSSHNTTSPRNTTDLSYSPSGEIKHAANSTGGAHVAHSVETKKEGNAMRGEIGQSSEAPSARQEEVNDLQSHKQTRRITDFFRKTPKASTTTSTKAPTTAVSTAESIQTMSTRRANLPLDKDKLRVRALSHPEKDGSKTSSVSCGEVHQAQAATKTDQAVKKQSRKDSVSSSSAPSIGQMSTAPSHAKTFTSTSPSLRSKSTASAPQQTTEMSPESRPAPATQATKTRRASATSAISSATSGAGTDDHDHHHTSESASDGEDDNQNSNPAPTTRIRRASRLSNVFINTVDDKPATHTARRKSQPEAESSESDASDGDDQVTSRKRKPGIVCADTMIKNWKRYGYESAKDARKQVGRILAKADTKLESQDPDRSSTQEADGVGEPKVRRQARKGTVRVETMIKNWGRYNFANAAEARAVSAGLSQDTELGVDEIATMLKKHKASSHNEQVGDTQVDGTHPEDLSDDELEEVSLETATATVDSAAPTTAADVFTLEPRTYQQDSPSQSHNGNMDSVTDTKAAKAARALKKLTMDVSPGIFGSPPDATGRRSRQRKRRNMGDDADVELLPITPAAAAMAPPSTKRIKVASPLAPGLVSTRKTTPSPALPPTSDPTTTADVAFTPAQPATPDGQSFSSKSSSINLLNPSPLRNGVTTSPQVAVSSFTSINQHDKKTVKQQKELDRLRMDVAPGIFASKSASPRSTRGEKNKDALSDLDLPIAPAINPAVNVKKSNQNQDKKKQERKDKEKGEQKQTQGLKRTNPSSLVLSETSPRAIAPPSKKLKLNLGPRKFGSLSASSSALTASRNTSSISANPSQRQTEQPPLPSDIVGEGPIPRFLRAESTTPSAVAVDCEHVEKGWMVINPVYVNSLYDYLKDLDTENDEEEEDDERVQAKDRNGEEHDEEENVTLPDSLTTEQEKAQQRNENQWENDEAPVAELNERMLKEVEMIMNWSVMTDAEKRDAGIAD